MLQEKGYPCDTANSGLEALVQIKQRFGLHQKGKALMYKLILLDYSMPDMDGPEVARQARKFFKEHSTSEADRLDPVICCCTAYTDATFMRQAFLAGMNKFLTKPVSDEELEECLAIIHD